MRTDRMSLGDDSGDDFGMPFDQFADHEKRRDDFRSV
jgi:hypothetical protein